MHITVQSLRRWFSVELTRLRVPDRYVDALSGRIPKTILARHYEYSHERLKEIYERLT